MSSLIEKYNIEDFSLVMDIEGAEVDLLLNDIDSLIKCRLAVIEFHPMIDPKVYEAYTNFISYGFEEIERCPCMNWVGVYKNVRQI